jgi:hypothetical protein
MRIHVLSDLHTEFTPYIPDPAADRADVVVLAGDIGVRTRGVEWAKRTFRQPTFYVPGNHEYYGGHLHRTLLKMSALNDERFMVADCDEMIVGDVRLLGFTAWTDYTATGNQPWPHGMPGRRWLTSGRFESAAIARWCRRISSGSISSPGNGSNTSWQSLSAAGRWL